MKTKRLQTLVLAACFLLSAMLFAQQQKVSGVLKGNDGLPLPGVNVIVKGTTKGTVTDFDGKYTVFCKVGDVLAFSYIGFEGREVKVTPALFDQENKTQTVEIKRIDTITSSAYLAEIEKIKVDTTYLPSLSRSKRTYKRKKSIYSPFFSIRHVKIDSNSVELKHFKPKLYFEVGLRTKTGFQFVKENNLPELQNIYAQGLARNGNLVVQGPETGNVFSYGPELHVLAFNGVGNTFDTNGQLMVRRNGSAAQAYDNRILKTSSNITNSLFFNISSDVSLLNFDVINRSQKDLYNIETSTANTLSVEFKNRKGKDNLSWDAFVRLDRTTNRQPNINGFQNNILLNAWATPISFSNAQGALLADGRPRSFSPNRFNNPEGLLRTHDNGETHRFFASHLKNSVRLFRNASMHSKINYSSSKNTQLFGVDRFTNGFENGYRSERVVEKDNFNAALGFDFKFSIARRSNVEFKSMASILNEDLKYSLFQEEGFQDAQFENSQQNDLNTRRLHRNTLRLKNTIAYKFNRSDLEATFIHNAYGSSLQNSAWFLPTVKLRYNLNNILKSDTFYDIYIASSTAYNVNDVGLLYDNASHNSLNIKPEESLGYRAVNDLFSNENLNLERVKTYKLNLNLGFRIGGMRYYFDATHYRSITRDAVFPVFENDAFQLKNVADITNTGVDMSLKTRINFSRHFKYKPSLTFASYRPKVTKLLEARTQIPIAGFSTVSQQLIEGQPSGVIVGSAYLRDTNANVVIGDDGFPLVDSTPQIIGNAIPKYSLGIHNRIELHQFALDIVIDIQKGGDVWNGTQNVLNYLGTSQQSAIARQRNNFIFRGVTSEGILNTTPVAFYDLGKDVTESRFVRNGFEGVAEDAIVDGSYVNLKSVTLSYDITPKIKDKLIREFKVGVYAQNVFTWTKYRGASPYNTLYGNTATKGLHFFNTPLASEIGVTFNLKL